MARSSKTQRDIDEIMAEMDGSSSPTPAGDVLEAVAVETTATLDTTEEPQDESGPKAWKTASAPSAISKR
jgi:hypothetical protein